MKRIMCEKVVLAREIGLILLAMRNSGIGAFSYNVLKSRYMTIVKNPIILILD